MPALTSDLPLAQMFSADYLTTNRIFPLGVREGQLQVAVAGYPLVEVLDDLELTYEATVELTNVDDATLDEAIRRTYAAADSMVELVKDLHGDGFEQAESWDDLGADTRDLANQPPVVRFVNLLIREAFEARASDIHLETNRGEMRIRYRVDGVLGDAPSPPEALHAAIVSRVKLLAQLDIAERRVAQDGRVQARLEDRLLDIRVSTIPTMDGESVVLRLLDRGGTPIQLTDLGMASQVMEEFRSLVTRPHGIVLATGPTGSGKTTTLYAALLLRSAREEKIITVEDPVEYRLPGVAQVPVNRRAGTTFATALRNLLRQDPDVLLIGEMRDSETAAIAVQAAMTGHLVLSTLHTNDATAAIPRLVSLNVEPYLVAAAVEGILAQRLVRQICRDCRVRYAPDPEVVALLARRPVGKLTLERGQGCSACRGTGYRGRTGIFELFRVSEQWHMDIAGNPANPGRRHEAIAQGMRSLRDDGWAKVQAGITTVEEVLRVTQ